MRLLLANTAVGLSLGVVGTKADILRFRVVDPVPGGTNTATFELPENPTPTTVSGSFFAVSDVPVTLVSLISGKSGTGGGTDQIGFFEASNRTETILDFARNYSADSLSCRLQSVLHWQEISPSIIPP